MHDLESMKFVNEKVKDSNDSYDFSNRRSEDLMYVILNPEEHTPAAVDAAKNELNSRNIPIEKHEEIVSDAILIKEIELASHVQSLSKNERILVCMTPPKLTFIITWYFKQRGYTQKLNEMDNIPFLERFKYICIFGLILLVVIVSGYKISEHIDDISSAVTRIFN